MQKLLSDEEYYGNLPKKHIGAGVLVFNQNHQLLIVKPIYKDGWSIPGGGVDIDETPMQAALRETKEEANLDLKNIVLVCVEYTAKKGIKPETLQFIFNGGELAANEIGKISLDENEHSEFKFVEVSEAINLLNERQQYVIPFCIEAIKNNNTVYIEL
ncbi:MAG: NUDIX domain-containing protein [Patescibacteria group bacterium]